MSPVTISIVAFACTFCGAMAGVRLRSFLPSHHLSDESRDTIKVGIGLVETMTALVLGLVTALSLVDRRRELPDPGDGWSARRFDPRLG